MAFGSSSHSLPRPEATECVEAYLLRNRKGARARDGSLQGDLRSDYAQPVWPRGLRCSRVDVAQTDGRLRLAGRVRLYWRDPDSPRVGPSLHAEGQAVRARLAYAEH